MSAPLLVKERLSEPKKSSAKPAGRRAWFSAGRLAWKRPDWLPGNHAQLSSEAIKVHAANSPAEREAERMAKSVLHPGEGLREQPAAAGQAGRHDAGLKAGGQGVNRLIPPDSGRALPSATRRFMEDKFGQDFSDVRVYADDRAAHAAALLQARALTLGQGIVFGAGQYAPQTPAGNELIAHELAHVVQQAGKPKPVSRWSRWSKEDSPAAAPGPAPDTETAPVLQGNTAPGIQRSIEVLPGVDLQNSLDKYKITNYSVGGNVYTRPFIPAAAGQDSEIVAGMLQSSKQFKLAGADSAEAGQQLDKHIETRMMIVQYAYSANMSFAPGGSTHYNTDLWEPKPDGSWQPKAGVDRMVAVLDMFGPGSDQLYGMGCKQARGFVLEAGTGGGPLDAYATTNENDIIPGDGAYVVKINAGRFSVGGEGENLIYVGNGLFWGLTSRKPEIYPLDYWRKHFVDEVEPIGGAAEFGPNRVFTLAGLR